MKTLLTMLVLCASIAQAQNNYPIRANVVPGTTNTYDLGTSALLWDSAYVRYISGTTVILTGNIDALTFDGFTLDDMSAADSTYWNAKLALKLNASDTTAFRTWSNALYYSSGESPTFAFTISTDSLDVGNTATQGPGVLRLVNDEGQVARLKYVDGSISEVTATFPALTGTVLLSDADQDATDLGDVTLDALTSGLINGQTISSAAAFTGTASIMGYTAIGSATASGNVIFGGTKFRVEHAGNVALGLKNTSANSLLALLAGGSANSIGSDRMLQFYINSGIRGSIDTAGNFGIGTITQLARLAINGGLHVGGDSDPGDNNLLVDGSISGGSYTGGMLTGFDTTRVGYLDKAQTWALAQTFSTDININDLTAGHGATGNQFNTALGKIALRSASASTNNTAIGWGALSSETLSGAANTGSGSRSLQDITTGGYNTGAGYWSGLDRTTTSYGIFLGYASGAWAGGVDYELIINSVLRGSYAEDTTLSIIYGVQAATVAAQRLRLNAKVNISDALTLDGNLDLNSNDILEVDSLSGRVMVLSGNATIGGTLGVTGTVSSDSSFTINERSTIPSLPTSNTQMKMYMKGDKLIWVINTAGTPRFYYFDATATADQSIIYSATEP